MKLRNLFMAVMAGAALLTGCNKEVDLGPAKIEMSTNTLTLSQGEASQAITFTATRDWVITGIPDWIAVSAEEGVGSPDPQKVTVSVNANSGFNRRADLIFTIGFARQALTIIQEGPSGAKTEGMGTKTDPYTVAGVKEYIGTLDGATSPVKVYIKGKISAIKEEFSAQYGNGNFTISEDGSTTGEQFTAYRVLYLGNAKWKEGDTQIKVGDEVVLYGNVVLYNGTYETSQGNAFLYELNGVNKGGDEGGSGGGESAEPKGTGTESDPFNAAAANAALKAGTTTEGQTYYIAGKVASIKDEFGSQYGNATFYINDSGNAGDESFYCYRVLYLGNKKWTESDPQIKVGDEVVIAGEIVLYNGTPETSAGKAYIYKLNDGGGSGSGESAEAKGTGTETDPFNAIAANAAIKAGTTTEGQTYYIAGKIASIKDEFGEQYGNATFYINDSGSSEDETFYCFRVLYLGNQKWTATDPQIKVGDEVVIAGELTLYNGTPETSANKAYIYKLNAGGGDQPGGDTPGEGDGSQANPFTVAQAVNAVKDLTWTDKDNFQKVGPYYVKGKISSIKYTYSAQYGTATFNISDDGSTNGAQFTCYSVKYYNGEKWVDGNTQVAVGDEVVIYGELQNYQGNTPETVSGAYVVSINAEPGGDQPGGDTPGEGDGSQANPFTVAQAVNAVKDLTWTDKDNFQKVGPYYVKGTISSIKYTYSAQYGTATFNISDDGTTDGAQFTCYSVKYYNGEKWVDGNTQVKVGDKVVIYGELQNYQGNTPETVSGAYVVSINAEPGGDQPGGDTPGGDTDVDIMDSNVTMIAGTNAYDDGKLTVTYNGKTYSDVKHIKYGKGSAYGNGSIVLPAGTAEISFFAVGWKGNDATLQFTIGETVKKVNVTANDGAANTSPYTMTVADTDHYTVSLGTPLAVETTVKVETVADANTGYRAFLFGVHANKTSSGGDQPGGDTPGGDTPGGDEPSKPVNEGTEANPFTVADALLAAKDAEYAGKEYYVSAVVGKDITIKNGTASFELVDGTSDAALSVVKAKSFEGADFTADDPIDWLDEVVLKGTVTTLAGSLPALTDGVLVLWNGQKSFTEPAEPTNDGLTPETAFTASEARAWVLANITGNNNTGDAKYYVKGKMSKWVVSKSVEQSYTNCASYGNASFYITDDGTDNDNWFEAYQVNYLEGKKWEEGQPDLAVGDEVVVYGPLARYGDTPETQGKSAAYLYSLNGKTSIPHDGLTLATAFTPSEARTWILANITGNNNTGETKYYVKGKMSKWVVSKSVEQSYTNCASYGNASFYMTDDGTDNDNWFEAYQVNYLEGKKWQEGWTDVAVGDDVVVYGPLARYGDTPETQGKSAAYLYSLNGVTEAPAAGGGDEPGGGDQPGGGDEPGGGDQPGSGSYVKVTTAPTDWSGTYLLVNNDGTKAFSGFTTSGTVYGIGADVTSAEGVIAASDEVNAYKLIIAPATVTSGAYTIKFGDKYLNWTTGNSLTGADAESANTNWNISIDAGSSSAYIVNAADAARKIRWNNNSPRFATYTSAQTDVQLYKLAE